MRLARRLKRSLMASVSRAVRGQTLVSPSTLESIKDVVLADPSRHPFRPGQAVRSLRRAYEKLKRAPIVLVHAQTSCAAEGVIKSLANVPLVLFNTGHADTGAPLRWPSSQRTCARRILALPNVVRWFMTHHNAGDPSDPKVDFLPVGFGARRARRGDGGSDLQLSPRKLELGTLDAEVDAVAALTAVLNDAYAVASRPSRVWMDKRLRFMYVCNNRWGARARILDRLNESDSMPGVRNSFPSTPREFFCGALQSLVTLSPGGTAPDGYRHAEFLLAGTVVVMPEHPCVRRIWGNLPVIHAEPGKTDHPPLTCDWLMAKLRELAAPNVTFEHERLTVKFWHGAVRQASVKVTAAFLASRRQARSTLRTTPGTATPHLNHS